MKSAKKTKDLFGQEISDPMPAVQSCGNQAVYTPDALAAAIVAHFMPSGRLCEPCVGGGAFARVMPTADFYEIAEGTNFLTAPPPPYPWDWLITNPPWELVAEFLAKAMANSNNIIFLCWLPALFTKARQRTIRANGFGMVEMLFVPTPPPPWPQSGFQLAAMWLRRGWTGGMQITHLAPD